ncbi:MAG TPA: flagellar motor switch phosphatase FliY [Spirochaetota bacterium]|nr:flagellar motor switch phosphatase FliY [Spirochaetota bacterium]
MSDGSLSQDEIDALLQGTDDVDPMSGFDAGDIGDSPLSQSERNSFLDLVNSASTNIGGALGAMIGRTVTLSNPRLEIVTLSDLQNQLEQEIVEVKMDFESGASGEHSYVIDVEAAQVISGLMMGQEGGDLTEASLSAVSEAMNIICGNALNTIGTQVKKELRTSPPTTEKTDKMMLSFSPAENFVKVIYDFSIEGSSVTQLVELFSIGVVKELTSGVVPASNEASNPAGNSGGQQKNQGQTQMNQNMMGQGQPQYNMNQGQMGMNPNMMNMGQPFMMNQGQMMGMNPNMMNMGQPFMMNQGQMGMNPAQVQNVQFSNFNSNANEPTGGNINLLMDVNMELTVELGRTKKSIKDILGMGEGTVIELDKLAGEAVDILVNGKLIAKGEVVVIDENFGVRVTEIISPMERIRDFS